MRFLLLALSLLFFNISYAQMQVHCGEPLGIAGQQICVPVTVTGFENMVGFQFSLNWDDEELQSAAINNITLSFLSPANFLVTETGLSVAWFVSTSQKVTLEDGAPIFDICFLPNGMPGDTLSINATQSPTIAAAVQCVGEDTEEFTPIINSGEIILVEPMQVSLLNLVNLSCHDTTDGSLEIEVINGIPPYSFAWSPENGDSSFIENLVAGSYEVTVSDTTGDTVVDTFTISTPTLLFVNTTVPDLSCTDSTGTISLTGSGGTPPYNYELEGIANTTGNFIDLSAGSYLYQVIDANDCLIFDTVTVTEIIEPEVSIVGDTFACNDIITLQAQGDEGTLSWFLNGSELNENQNTLQANETGNYSVLLTNADECTADANIDIIIADAIDIYLEVSSYKACEGDTIFLFPQGNPFGNYEWTVGDIQFTTTGDAFFTSENDGVFVIELAAETNNSCPSDILSEELFFSQPEGYAMPDTCIKKGENITLYAFAGESYFWEETVFPVNNSETESTTAQPEETTEYPVLITDTNGCSVMDTVKVEVVGDPANAIRLINFITPNEDGENDFLVFDNINKYSTTDLRVFNIHGKEVFSAINYQNDWGGTYKGNKLPSGVYFYILSVAEGKIESDLTIIND